MKTKDIAGSAGASAPRAERAEALRNDSTRTEANRADATRADATRADATRGEPEDHTCSTPARGANVDWRAVLAGASPREVLARLVNADVFEVRARVARALAERCYLLDGDLVYLRCIARIARFATRYRGEPSLDAWLSEQVDAALLDALERADARGAACASQDGGREDLSRDGLGRDDAGREFVRGESAREGDEHPAAHGRPSKASHAVARNVHSRVAPTFLDLARPLGLDPDRMRDVCSAFNRCAPLERAAFFGVVLERGDLESVAARLGVAPAECARAARHALERCMERATAAPASSGDEELPKGAAAQARASGVHAADAGAIETASGDGSREMRSESGNDGGSDSEGPAVGRSSRVAPGALVSERRAAARGPAAAAAPPPAARTVTYSMRSAASRPVGERDELRARTAAASDSGRSSFDAAAAGAAPHHARGAERRTSSRGERGDVR